MALNYHYAAHTYLDLWAECDRDSRKVLDFGREAPPGVDQACKQLAIVANSYGIARNFKKEHEKNLLRLSPAWAGLVLFRKRPTSQQDAKDFVEQLVGELRSTYKNELLSAASKLLWMRFGSPIVIYDSNAWKWMCQQGGCSTSGDYSDYYDAWRKSFLSHKKEIKTACSKLRNSKARKFLCPGDVRGQEFEELVSSHWFAERVFDHAIVNEMTGLV